MPVEPSTPARPARPSLRRKLGFTVIALLTGITLLSILTSGTPDSVRSQLEAIRAAGAPIDTASLATWISPVPAAENGALQLLELIEGTRKVDSALIPRRARSWDAAQLSWAASERDRLQSWRTNIHAALRVTRFRYPVVVTNGIANLGVAHLDRFKGGSWNLAFWASHSAALHQPDESGAALLDTLRLARTLDDEPVVVSWLVRNACLAISAIAAENALTLSPLSDAQLVQLQAAFLDADQPGTLTRALLTERALGYEACHASPAEFIRMTLAPPGPAFGTPKHEWIAAHAAQTAYRLSGAQGSDSEYYLKTLGQLIDISRLSGSVRVKALSTLKQRFNTESVRWNRQRARTFAGPFVDIISRDQHTATLLRTASVACAIERFRNAHQGQLPASLADLVPAYLPAIPLDPATDHPLRFRPLNTGYVVYGLGPDGEDNHGKPAPKNTTGAAGIDVPFTVER
jgi:hypothetical protein